MLSGLYVISYVSERAENHSQHLGDFTRTTHSEKIKNNATQLLFIADIK